jgi:serine protease Do
VKAGEWVMAIGSPFGLENTVTAGIVSAKSRDTGELVPFIQSDVAINPGNSGGPLINMRGEVIGINSQIYTRSGGSMGVSFSIPIDEANRIADQLRSGGRVQRGRLGVRLDSVSKDVAETIGLAKAQGALIVEVQPDTPAAKAGIEAGDIILRIDGKQIERFVDVTRTVSSMKPGTSTKLTLFRRGQTREVTVIVGEAPAENVARAGSERKEEPKPQSTTPESLKAFGLTVSELTDKQRTDLKIKGGVRVDASEGQAGRAGIRAGDIILALANVQVNNVKDLEAAVAKADKTKNIGAEVRSGELTRIIVIRPR